MHPTLNRIVILGWPIVATFILVPVLKAIDSPPNLTVVVFAIVGTIAGALIGGELDIPEKWLKPIEGEDRGTNRTGPTNEPPDN